MDAPCGTGRFFEDYIKRDFFVTALDVSSDMLMQAGRKLSDPVNMIDGEKQFRMVRGNILESGLETDSVDVVMMIRITRWLSVYQCEKAFKEMQRIAKDTIIMTARVQDHMHARPVELFTDNLLPGWKLHDNHRVHEDAYRVLVFKWTG